MAKNNPRLELTWIGEENRARLEPCIRHDDCSLQVENLPKAPPPAGQQVLELE